MIEANFNYLRTQQFNPHIIIKWLWVWENYYNQSFFINCNPIKSRTPDYTKFYGNQNF